MAKSNGGFSLILGATAIAGVAGYLVTWVVFRQVGPAAYATFAVFWSALYLVIGGLSGIQHEITRATHPIAAGERLRPSRARNFVVVAAVLVFVLILATAPAWQASVFPEGGWGLVLPLALGAGSYVLVAGLAGSLYGVEQWRSLALLIAGDGVLRLAFLGIGLLLTRDVVALAWIVALPFPLTIMILWPMIRGSFVGRSDVDVAYRELSWNVARTVAASVSTAVLVSGLPLLLGIAAHGDDPALLGELIFTITLARAPLIVTVLSLQSVLVVKFRDAPEAALRTFLLTQAVIVSAALVIGVAGFVLGPTVFAWVVGGPFSLSGGFIAILVVSSALVGALCVSGAAVLARSRHIVYTSGWAVAAIATVVTLLLPVEFLDAVTAALLVGPVAGLLVHLAWLARVTISERRSS